MWATVGAALKKIAVALLGNPKVLKTIGGIVLGLIIIIVMPVVAIVSIFNGDIEIDTNELQRMVVENLSAEEQAKLQFVEDTMYAIEREMKASGFSDPRVTEAQVLFTLSLYDYAQEADFVSKLVGCFASEQTDEQLIAAVNAAFGTAISAEEFSQVMGAIRSVYIDTSGYIDPCTKNNLDLVEWAKQAKLRGWGYVWGTYGEVLTRSYYNAKAEQYPDEVGGYADFIESNWLGGRTSDCNGLIKGYALGKLFYQGEAVPKDVGKALYHLESAAEKDHPYAAYLAGKIRLSEEGYLDVEKAVRLFEAAAALGNDFAEYQLGKLYLYGKDVSQNMEAAVRWLTASAEHGNQYAAQLLHSVRNNKNLSVAMASLRLLHHISRMIQNRLEDERRGKGGTIIERKLRRQIEEKKQALGIRL